MSRDELYLPAELNTRKLSVLQNYLSPPINYRSCLKLYERRIKRYKRLIRTLSKDKIIPRANQSIPERKIEIEKGLLLI